jgi:hypothetical protein
MRTGSVNAWGAAATVETLFQDCGVDILRGNDNPRTGYAQLREYLRVDEARRFPLWHPRAGETGSPRMFVVGSACPHLSEQLRTAPLQPIDKRHAGEMVDPVWESRRGHAVAAARYGVLSRPVASPVPPRKATDADWVLPREFAVREFLEGQQEQDDELDEVLDGAW